jgi:phosphoribosylaminoimidazolecarboxamide formyltransferase/IMP cyclohydrolase
MIASWLEEHDSTEEIIEGFPQVLRMELSKAMDLRYGENPHQRAALYVRRHANEASASAARKLSGLDLSFNNLLDATAAFELVKELDEPGVAVVKHTNPCGAAVNECVAEAYKAAYAGDPNGAYGAAVGLNRRVDAKIATEMARPDRLVEVVIAPAFDEDAVQILVNNTDWGKRVRLLAAGDIGRRDKNEFDIRAITGGFLRQDRDLRVDGPGELHVVTDRKPDERQMAELKFAAVVCKHVKSNAIVVANNGSVVGVGGGQMTHADASLCAIRKAGDRIKGSCAATDAFIWFPDTLEILAEAGVSAIIQPNGEGQHEHIVKVADTLGLTLVLTTVRHFSH